MRFFRQLYRTFNANYTPPSNLTKPGIFNNLVVFPTHHTNTQLKRYILTPNINQHGQYVKVGFNPKSKKDPLINEIIYEFDPKYMS